jgi:hypothetical protein
VKRIARSGFRPGFDLYPSSMRRFREIAGGRPRRTSSVLASSIESWGLAGAATMARGIPFVPASRLRLTSELPRWAGLGTVASATRGAFVRLISID